MSIWILMSKLTELEGFDDLDCGFLLLEVLLPGIESLYLNDYDFT
jgi:hypothetical protein